MCERVIERERETGSHLSTSAILIAASSFLRERDGHITAECTACQKSSGKTMDIIKCFNLFLKAEARNYGKRS